MNIFFKRASFIFIGLLILVACSDGPERDVEYTIYVTHPTIEMIEGEELQVTASPTTQSFTWETTDASVATVSSTGLVSAISDGTCLVNITSSEGLSRSIPVDVEQLRLLTGIDVYFKANLATVDFISLLIGNTTKIDVSAIPSNYNERVPFNVIFESSDENIITIDDVGLIRTVNIGNAEIIISVKDKPSVSKVIPVEVLE